MELNFSNKTLYFINNLSINIEQSLFTKTMFKTKEITRSNVKCKNTGWRLSIAVRIALWCLVLGLKKRYNFIWLTSISQSNDPVLDPANHCLWNSQCSKYNRLHLSQYCSSSSALAVVKQWRLYSSKSWYWNVRIRSVGMATVAVGH